MCALLVALALCATPGPAVSEDVYRWVDEQGRVHFSSTPPPGQRARKWEGEKRDEINVVGDRVNAPPARVRPRSRTGRGVPGARTEKPKQVGGRSESEWRAQAVAMEQKISGLEQAIESVEDGPEFYRKTYRRNGVRGKRENKASRLRGLESKLQAAQDSFDRFEERARKAGVPPGWLR